MSELTEAMEAALASVEPDQRRPPAAPRPTQDLRLLRDEDQTLPPITSRRTPPRTFAETLAEQYGPVAATAWTTLREGVLLLVLFWTAAILLAFVEVGGVVSVPGVGDATVISASVVAAVVLRAVLKAASLSGQAIEARVR